MLNEARADSELGNADKDEGTVRVRMMGEKPYPKPRNTARNRAFSPPVPPVIHQMELHIIGE